MKEGIFIIKTACLLHDPPNKAWLLIKHKDHKELAKQVATGILKNTCLKVAIEHIEEIAKPADILAASIDRWLLSKIIGDDYNLFQVSEIKLKNIFNPKFSQRIEKTQPPIDEFVKALGEMIRNITDPRLAYHVLYACYEPEWILCELPAGPADTRTPSHSIFDHNYATASMVNWLLKGKEPRGILLYIDLGGPQKFISGSRKLIDLWSSSYLASALAWSVFWIFIKVLGPDVMVLPTCRGNPFYYHSLISELYRNDVDKSIIEKIKQISRIFAGYDPDIDIIPRYAVVPVTATFMLPELEQLRQFDEFKEIEVTKGTEGLEEFVRKKYQEIWRGLYDKVIEKCKDLQNELGELAIQAGQLLEECKRFGFDKTPPLPIRVIALHTERIYELGLEKQERYSLYHYMFKLLNYEESKRKIYKHRPEEDLNLFEMTLRPLKTWPKETTKGFEYCSICGYFPAIIIFPSNEEEYGKCLKIELEPIFGIGERLCPYCLIKRLVRMSEVLKLVVDELIGQTLKEPPGLRFPSVSDIALIPFRKSFITKAIKIENIQRLTDELNKWIYEIWKRLAEKKIPTYGKEPVLDVERRLREMIKEIRNDELKRNLEEILFLDAESCFLRKHKFIKNGKEEDYIPRRDWLELKRRVYKHKEMAMYMNLERDGIDDLNTYYAIIRCDGDNLGKMIQGRVNEGFRITVEEYLCNMLEGDAGEIVKAILSNDYERARKIYNAHNVKEVDEKLDTVSKLVRELQYKGEIIISPSYHSSLSKALMINAVRDKKIIDHNDGLTIYAGGDDLLAITPVKNSLNVVRELREKFSFPLRSYKGFDILGEKYLVPSLATASRSFSLYITHYMYPLYLAIRRSAELLEDIAKVSAWMMECEERRKDALVLAYSPRGGECHALLPLSSIKGPNQNLSKNIKYLNELIFQMEEKGLLSHSLIYDFYSNLYIIIPLIKDKNKELLGKIFERIFEKNCEILDKTLRRQTAEQWAKKLVEDYDILIEIDHERLYYLKQFFLALMLYRSGLRGVE